MLRSSFLSSVRPFYAPDNDGGGDDGALETDVLDSGDGGDSDTGSDGAGGAEAEGDQGQGEGSQKPLSVREEIKKAMDEASGEKLQEQPKPKVKKAPKAAASAQQGQQQQAPASTTPAPARLSAEAKADWDKTPPAIQQAFIKAEQDMQRGVDELKQRYSLIDQAMAPHIDAIRQMNATPAEAVNRMFLWFKALANSPAQSYPALAKAMGHDWNQVFQQTQGQQQQGQQQSGQQQQAAPEIPPYVRQLEEAVQRMSARLQEIDTGFGSMRQDVQQQNEQKARDNLNIWSQGKKYFEEVRRDMANLLQNGMIPLTPQGQVDLDKAYETAIYMNPEVRARVLAEQQQANQQVQQESEQAQTTAQQTQVTKARKAAVSLPASAPGTTGVNSKKPELKKGSSVRDALRAAMAEVREANQGRIR